ncbi:DUF5977 domain-containing protein [Ornithobacterium rhinotracheale]|uniref:DUF5977 domain-containing protein n=1 Tax=Ornithobacterium rhinotracheale TaxID=28251 RepID=UPI0040363154
MKFFSFVLTILNSIVFCQIPNIGNLQSPNISSLGIYGEIPVSLFTGTPNISIPLSDNLQTNHFALPFSINYHTGIVKPDQHPGWVGLGWNLNIGGAIYRIVKDLPDEYNQKNYGMYLYEAGFLYSHKILDNDSWGSRNFLRKVAQGDLSFKDTEPDIFNFNFLGIQGSFYLNHKGEWIVKSKKPLKVVFNNEFTKVPFHDIGMSYFGYREIPYPKVFYGFSIFDEKGVQYKFGSTPEAVEYSIDFFTTKFSDWMANAWKLNEIIFPNGEKIKFSYVRKNFVNQMYINVYNVLRSKTESRRGIFSLNPNCYSSNFNSVESSYSGKLISPTYLSEISSKYFKINFHISPSKEIGIPSETFSSMYSSWRNHHTRESPSFLPYLDEGDPFSNLKNSLKKLIWYKLDFVEISDLNKRKKEKISFVYNNKESERLFLLSITKSGKETTKNDEKYSFEYNNLNKMPPYLSNKVDHWGYYNGHYASIENINNYYESREPNGEFSTLGLLTKIIYPTGGSNIFEYEPHDYSKQLSFQRWERCEQLTYNKLAGGARIKKIISINNVDNGKRTEKEYFYVNNFNNSKKNISSSGVLGGQTKYYFLDYKVRAFNNKDTKMSLSIFSSQSVLPLSNNSLGSHIGYTNVVEKKSDGSFIINNFSNFDNGYLDEAPEAIIQESRGPYEAYSSKEEERGLLLKRTSYDKSGNFSSSEEFSYTKNKNKDLFVRSMKAQYKNICPNTAVSYDEGVSYKIYTYTMIPLAIKRTTFTPNGNIVSYERFKYNNKGLLSNHSKQFGNEKIEYKHKYVCDEINKDLIIEDLNKKHQIGLITEKTTLKNGEEVEKIETKYHNFKNIIAPIKITSKRLNKIIKELKFLNYDSFGNPIEISYNNYNFTSFIYGYNQQLLIAKLQGVKYSEIPTDLIKELQELSDNGEEEKLNSKLKYLRTLFPNALITTYTHDPLVGIKSITSPNNSSEYYEYNDQNRLSKILDDDKNIKKEYYYNYAKDASLPDGETEKKVEEKLFYNTTTSKQFLKKNCPSSQIGDIFTYSVPANKYISIVSQNDANQKALYDIEKNGQMMANEKGTCFEMDYSVEGIDDPDFLSDGSVQKTDSPLLLSINLNFINNPSDNPCGQYVGRLKGRRITRQEIITGNRGEWLVTIEKTGEIFVKLRDINKDKPKRPIVYDKDGNKLDYFEDFTPWLYKYKGKMSISFNYSIDIEKEDSFSKFINNFNRPKRCFHISIPKEPIRIF